MMKKILLIALLSFFSIACSQNKSSDYSNEVKDLKAYVENVYKNDSAKIKSYVKNSQNGKIYSLKSKDVYDEYGDMVYENIYKILERDESIIYIKRLPYYWAEGMPFNMSSYEYYFDENKRLIGAKKSTYEEDEDISYNIEYILNNETDKLERIEEYYADMNGKKLDSKSKKVKVADKDGLTKNFIKNLDKITFRDLEGFMNVEKIKYYKADKNESKMETPESKKNIIDGKDSATIENLIKRKRQ